MSTIDYDPLLNDTVPHDDPNYYHSTLASLASSTNSTSIPFPDVPVCDDYNSSCACQTEYNFYEWNERVLLGLLALPIIAFGIVANLTSVRIFTHRLMSSSSINWYLAVLSASDSVILIASFFVLSLPRAGEYLTWWAANYVR